MHIQPCFLRGCTVNLLVGAPQNARRKESMILDICIKFTTTGEFNQRKPI